MTSPLCARPALRFALLLALGILAGRLYPGPPAPTCALLVTLLVSSLAGRALGRTSFSGVTLSISIVVLGSHLSSERVLRWQGELLHPRSTYDEVRVTGLVLDEPVWRSGTARFVVAARVLEVRGTPRGGGRVLVRLRQADSATVALRAGSTVTVSGFLDPVPVRRNPGERDPQPYYCLHTIRGVVSALGPDVGKAAPGPPSFTSAVAHMRRRLADILDRLHAGETRSYLKGIVLAMRGEMSDEQRDAFLVSGTFHVIAVSGLHVGLITVMLHAALGLLRLPRRALILGTMAGVLGYMVLVGSSPSVVRAAVMACVVLGGRLIERPVDVLQSLGVAASIVLLSDPVELFDPGFQLSFAAVFAIVTLSGLWRGAACRIPRHTFAGRLTGALFQLLTVSASAQIGTMPITLLLFERLSVVSLAANVVIVPLSSVNVALGISTLVFDHISAALAAPYAAANDLIAQVVLDVAALSSSVPGASISTAGWSPFAAIAIPVVLLGVLSIRRAVIVKACLFIVLALATGWLFQSLSRARVLQLAVTVLDVGQGDAILIESPDGVRVLLDGGPATLASDAGERIIVPYLARRGIDRLEAVILSHGHSDHIGGIAAVLEQVSVSRLLVASEEVPGATAEQMVQTARRRGTRLERIARGTVLSVGSSVRLYVLHPPGQTARVKTLNNISIVCKLVYGDFSIFFAGDIETEIEDDLVHRYGSFLNSEVLKVAHHGSATSSSPSFLDAVAPETAVISVGWRNRFYHPSPGTLREFARRGIRTLRTDRFGAMIIASDGRSVKAAPWRDH